MQTRPIILIKIGGSLITDKNKPYSLRKKALKVIAQEVAKASSESSKQLIIGHGAGSFAHVPAKKYRTHEGLVNDESFHGISVVADVASRLNRIVVKQLLDVEVNALGFSPHSFMTSKNHGLDQVWSYALEQAMVQRQLPVVYGDQMLDVESGCTIFSTEKVLGYLGLHLKSLGYSVEKIIHCGQTNGVYDLDGNTIPKIDPGNIESYREALSGSGGTDVTGGMIHKVEETLNLAKQGIPGLIIDGIVHGSLSEAIAGKEVLGTKVEA